MSHVNIEQFKEFMVQGRTLMVLTGAGVSAPSGIPTYRDDEGQWKRSDPIQHQEFLNQKEKRQRYWARSLVGWKNVAAAKPNDCHVQLARLESEGRLTGLVTQNVDGLHQAAGQTNVIDLHGRLDQVVCLKCDDLSDRAMLQQQLESLNPELSNYAARSLPDGDADIDDFNMASVLVPDCTKCGGMLKPHVVFFGDNVPTTRVTLAMNTLDRADALLVVGSSLQVYSGYRFCKAAANQGKPIICINKGLTRADPLISIKIEMDAAPALSEI